ncbi:MAG: hypothetical protein AB8B69_06625 [Chitinophagales bacterium]
MPELLCFLVDMLLLSLIVLILNTIPKPPPPHLGLWKIKGEKRPSNDYEKAIWQFHDLKFELSPNENYQITSKQHQETTKYKVIGGGEYLIIKLAKTTKNQQGFGFLSFEDRMLLGGISNFLVFKILKVGEEKRKFTMQLQQIPFGNTSQKFPKAYQIRRQEKICEKNEVVMHQVSLERLSPSSYYRPLFPIKDLSVLLPDFMKLS